MGLWRALNYSLRIQVLPKNHDTCKKIGWLLTTDRLRRLRCNLWMLSTYNMIWVTWSLYYPGQLLLQPLCFYVVFPIFLFACPLLCKLFRTETLLSLVFARLLLETMNRRITPYANSVSCFCCYQSSCSKVEGKCLNCLMGLLWGTGVQIGGIYLPGSSWSLCCVGGFSGGRNSGSRLERD